MSIQYVVFTPEKPLSGVRFVYTQYEDGRVTETALVHGVKGLEREKDCSGNVLRNASEWARCLHSGAPHFPDSAEANEIYGVLCNANYYLTHLKNPGLARIAVEGIIADAQEWLKRLKAEEVAA